MKSAPFEYHSPRSVEEAVSLLAEHGEDAKILAGGQSLVPMLAMRLAVFGHLIDVGRIEDLKGVERRDGSVRIGATTTEAAVEADALVAESLPLVARATPLVGHFQIRNRGTLGGSVAHADPAAEYPAVALALDATMETVSSRGSRTVPAEEFFDGLWSTALAGDELLSAVSFPVWQGRCGFAIEEFARRHGDFALAGSAIALALDDSDRIERCAIALIGVAPTPVRARALEKELTGRPATGTGGADIGRAAVEEFPSMPSDLHAPAEQRKQLAAVMVSRAWESAVKEALQ